MKLTRVHRAVAVLGVALVAATLQGCAVYPVPVAPHADVQVDIGAGYYRPYNRPYYRPYYPPPAYYYPPPPPPPRWRRW